MDFIIKETWHRALLSSGAHRCLHEIQSFDQFPLPNLSSATNVYIKRKKLIPDTEACDDKLVDLVLEHDRRSGGVKDVAIISCLHALSHSAGTAMLVSLREECSRAEAEQRFLRCLILSHLANGLLVHAGECRAAEALLQLLNGEDFLSTARQLFQSLAEDDVNPSILSANYIISLLRLANFDVNFENHLSSLREQRKYMSLHNAVSWVGAITSLPETSTARAVVTSMVPHWRVWTSWRPNYFRLMQWEGGSFTDTQRARLSPIFDLEGPDTTGYGREALRMSPPDCFQYVSVLDQDPAHLERLLQLLDSAQRIPGQKGLELFIFLCVDNIHPIDNNLLSLTEAILDTQNNDCIDAMQLWLSNLPRSNRGFNNSMVALTKILPVLKYHPPLQKLLIRDISSDVVNVMGLAQTGYLQMLVTGVAENLAEKIHAFGRAILAADWLQPSLPADFIDKLRRLPPQETLLEVLDSLHQLDEPQTNVAKAYLSVIIGGNDGDAASMLRAIQRNIRLWGRNVQPDRANLTRAIDNLRNIRDDVQDDCFQRALVEDPFLARDLAAIIRVDTNISCVDLTRILARRVRMRFTVHPCWYQLLFSLLEGRISDVLAYIAEQPSATQWFEWVDDLRRLFPGGEDRRSVSELHLTPGLYSWWDLLSGKYRSVVTYLEDLHRTSGNLRWLWFKELPETDGLAPSGIVVLLDLLLVDERRRPPLERFILSHLKPVPYIIGLVCVSLAALRHATPQGRMAFESVHTRSKSGTHGRWPKSATEALIVSWRRSRDLSPSDRDGLRALSELLELRGSVDDNGICAAQTSLMMEYAKVISMARTLEELRRTIRSQEPAKAAAFFEELGVEDGMPGSDPTIPDKLSGVIENIGEQLWEMCFPLTHLSAQTKQAVGIDGTSRMLLVRMSFQRQQPAFCIHFHPNDEGTDRHHGPWTVNGEMPDGRVCWTRPTLLVYILSRALSMFLFRDQRSLESVYGRIQAILDAPAANCLVCTRSMGCRLWRPTVCSQACGEIFQRAPLEVRIFSLISDPPVLDLLLSCVYSAAGNPTPNMDLLPNCPIPERRLREVINSFPPLPANASPSWILSQIRASDATVASSAMSNDREVLLAWMSLQFRGCLVSAPQGSRVPAMPGVIQFLMLNANPDREMAFANYMAGLITARGARIGGMTFHGAAMNHMWRVLTEGLKKTPGSTPGTALQGIPLVDEPAMVRDNCGDTDSGEWEQSALQGRNVMLVCELAGHAWQGFHVISEESRVAVRYVLLLPRVFTPPPTGMVREGIRRTFLSIKEGVLREEGEREAAVRDAPEGVRLFTSPLVTAQAAA
ncbi:hypothetical protein B0H67DRAFT_594397 [Lasiosphaeris hirsuta]|uniref:Uncharacterized protein n=1 Tax=Lasiosphaeris hirsuta TaxID=260670 RepID=A0AA39ZXQ8_9PEZI|nr:hypothetical protein B0H67DRAFT_594397 [Lasiosphaeris hirsuta]